MLDAIKYNLTRLLDFSGREDRPTFWWYVLFIVILDIVLGLIVSGPAVIGSVATAIQAAQSGAGDDAVQAQVLDQMAPRMQMMMWASVGIALLMIALTTAAFVRRLHDSGNSGWWAAVAIAARLISFVLALSVVAGVGQMMASGNAGAVAMQQAHIPRFGLIGWIAPIIVVVFGVMNSTPGPNRYGQAPQAG